MKVRQLRFPDLGDVCKFSVSLCWSEVSVFLLHQSTDEADELCLPIGSGSQEYSFQMVTRSGIGDAHGASGASSSERPIASSSASCACLGESPKLA